MDKLQSRHSTQSHPLWERQKSERGHYSSVDKAIMAHRKRNAARMERVESRLEAAKTISNQFFVKPEPAPAQQNQWASVDRNAMVDAQQSQWNSAVTHQSPVDAIYEDAQLAPTTEHALQVLAKDAQAPADDGMQEDMPKGSYIDYQV
ncbi:MAG: hypothetical protein KDD33_10535 [Bdellovibrionales bacterium]|nr:hypothetical protein [Bdellovibrionales bacterium]